MGQDKKQHNLVKKWGMKKLKSGVKTMKELGMNYGELNLTLKLR